MTSFKEMWFTHTHTVWSSVWCIQCCVCLIVHISYSILVLWHVNTRAFYGLQLSIVLHTMHSPSLLQSPHTSLTLTALPAVCLFVVPLYRLACVVWEDITLPTLHCQQCVQQLQSQSRTQSPSYLRCLGRLPNALLGDIGLPVCLAAGCWRHRRSASNWERRLLVPGRGQPVRLTG